MLYDGLFDLDKSIDKGQLNIFRRSDIGKRDMIALDITFIRGKMPKIEIPLNFVALFDQLKKNNKQISCTSPLQSPYNVTVQRGPYNATGCYSARHINETYQSELGSVEKQVREIYERPNWNPKLREACFNKLKHNLRDVFEFDNENALSSSIELCKSVSDYVGDSHTKGTRPQNHEVATRILTAAVSYNSTLSCRELSTLTNLDKNRFIKKKVGDAVSEEDEDDKTDGLRWDIDYSTGLDGTP